MIAAAGIVLMGSLPLAFVLVAALAVPEQNLDVTPVARDGQVLVSFKLAQTLTPDLQNAIHSGLTVSFVYKVDLKRSSVTWIDRTLASAIVTATVRFDTLTRKYHLSRLFDGRTVDSKVTDREDLAWAWVTTQFEHLPLFRGLKLEDNAEYYVRIRAHTSPRNASFVWPWQGDDVVGLAKFIFLRR
jgi:hypothetical protein